MTQRRTTVLCGALCFAITIAAALGATIPTEWEAQQLKRPYYDRYLWRLAHHPDTLAAFELIINLDPAEPHPWAWHANRIGAAYYSQKQFRARFYDDLEQFYGEARAADEYARRQQFARKLDHSLWEMFQALAIYHREALLSYEQVEQAARQARQTVPQNRALIERLTLDALGEPLPPPREYPAEELTP